MAQGDSKAKTKKKKNLKGDVEAPSSSNYAKRKSLKKKKPKSKVKKEPPLNVSAADDSVQEIQEVSSVVVEDEKKEERSSQPPAIQSRRINEVPLDISEHDEMEGLSDPPAKVARLPDVYEHLTAQQMMEDARHRLSKMDDMETEIQGMRTRLLEVQRNQELDLEKQNIRKRKGGNTDMTPPKSFSASDRVTDKKQKGYDSDEEENYEVRTFPRNTFSFLLLARYPFCDKGQSNFEIPWAFWKLSAIEKRRWERSRDFMCLPFWFAISVLMLQIGIYTLALYNAVDFKNSKNPFKFPINVDLFTRTAELLAVLITVYTQNNIFQGVDLFVQSFKHIGKTPGVTIQKYYLAATTQVLIGLYGVFVTFIIIMQSQEVVDLLLNFTAMEFVAALDDAAFELSLRGFIGHPMKRTAKIVRDVRYNPRDKRKWLRKWPMFMCLLTVLTWYIMVRVDQDNRKYGDNVIYIQFNDDVIPWLSTLSGTYTGCTMSGSDNRDLTREKDESIGQIFYSKLSKKECKDNWKSTDAAFFFCGGERWVLAVGDDKFDPCNKWSMRSFNPNALSSDGYDVLSHASVDWFAKDTQNISTSGVLESLQFLIDFEPNAIDVNCTALQPTGKVFLSPLYEMIEGVKVRDRPVYFGTTTEGGEFIIYNGLRWITVKIGTMVDCAANCAMPDTVSCIPTCLQTFDPYQSNYTALWISDPMNLRTRSDTWIPTAALSWNRATSSGNGNAASPAGDERSLIEKLETYPVIIKRAEMKNATEEQVDEARSLFLQSAKLSCVSCEDDACEAILTCPNGGTRVWVDIKTDSFPEETCFVMKSKEASDAEFYNDCLDMTGLAENGVYDWATVAVNNLEEADSRFFRSCLPAADCGLIYWQDYYGDGMSPPGEFTVTVDGMIMQNAYYDTRTTDVDGATSCVYQFGKTCQQFVKCYVYVEDEGVGDDAGVYILDGGEDDDDSFVIRLPEGSEGLRLVYSSV